MPVPVPRVVAVTTVTVEIPFGDGYPFVLALRIVAFHRQTRHGGGMVRGIEAGGLACGGGGVGPGQALKTRPFLFGAGETAPAAEKFLIRAGY